METFHLAWLQAGLDETQFWQSTPYQSIQRVKAVQKARTEASLLTGWFAERFAREERLQSAQHYIGEMLMGGLAEEVTAEMAEAELSRMAMAWGLDLEDVEDEPEDG